MRRTITLLVTIALASFAGCKKESPSSGTEANEAKAKAKTATDPGAAKTTEPPKPDTATRTDKPAGDDAKPAGEKPKVTLLEPGAEPRRELRYKVDKGLAQTLDTSMEMAMENQLGGRPTPATKMPPMLMSMKIEVTESADEVFTYAYEMTKADVGKAAGVNPMIADAIKKELAKTVGMKGKAKVDSRGMTLEASVDVPDGVPAQVKQLMKGMQQSMDQMSSPLPTEAVGKGAKWRVDQVINQNGIVMTQQATFVLTDLTDDGASLSFELVQKADPQKFRPPGMPAEAKLLKLDGTGKGTSKLNFSKLAPVESTVEVSTATALELSLGGQTQKMSTKTDMKMQLKGK